MNESIGLGGEDVPAPKKKEVAYEQSEAIGSNQTCRRQRRRSGL